MRISVRPRFAVIALLFAVTLAACSSSSDASEESTATLDPTSADSDSADSDSADSDSADSDSADSDSADIELTENSGIVDHPLASVGLSLDEVSELTGVTTWVGPLTSVIPAASAGADDIECGIPAPAFAEQLTVDFADEATQTALYTLASDEGDNSFNVMGAFRGLAECPDGPEQFEALNIEVAGADDSIVWDVTGETFDAMTEVTFVYASFDGNLIGVYSLNSGELTIDAAMTAEIAAAMGAKLS